MSGQFHEEFEYTARHTEIEAALIPGTAEVIRAHSTEETLRLWRRECDRRGIVFDNIYRTWSDCACRALSPEWRSKRCRFLDAFSPALLKSKVVVFISDAWKFIKTAASWWRSDELVSQEQANERAATCAMCEFNSPEVSEQCEGCTGAKSKLADGILEALGGRHTTSDHRIHSCSCCRCLCKLLVHVPLDALLKHTDLSNHPAHCWKVREQAVK